MNHTVNIVVFEDGVLQHSGDMQWPVPSEQGDFGFCWHDQWNGHAELSARSLHIPESRHIRSDIAFDDAVSFAASELSGEAIVFIDLDFEGAENSPQTPGTIIRDKHLEVGAAHWESWIGANYREWLPACP